ncbi:hypothetical protein CVS40_3402 [Lucilia cuprina]|nr:hypothetical protein CVS40_3402 [Lucilia cuprina]
MTGLFTSSAHATAISHKLGSRNKVLKALAGSTWGMDKETLLATYKTIGRSVVNYAAPVWSPSQNDTHCQNDCNGLLANYLGTSPAMLTKQFLLGCHRRSHPNFYITQLDTPPRHVRKDLRMYEEHICRYVRHPLDQSSYSAALNDIHRDAINSAVAGCRMNFVLGGRPPPIADTEENLPRKTKVVLAQLRSGWSNRLNAYWSRIDRAVPNECPACGLGPHDTYHIFNCSAYPTNCLSRMHNISNCKVKKMASVSNEQNSDAIL